MREMLYVIQQLRFTSSFSAVLLQQIQHSSFDEVPNAFARSTKKLAQRIIHGKESINKNKKTGPPGRKLPGIALFSYDPIKLCL